MLEILNLMKYNLVEINAKGIIIKDDYKKLEPIIEKKIQKFGNIRLLINVGALKDIKLLAFWEDFKMSLKHKHKYDKIAVVGDRKPEEILIKPFAPLVSTHIKLFKNKSQAKSWIIN